MDGPTRPRKSLNHRSMLNPGTLLRILLPVLLVTIGILSYRSLKASRPVTPPVAPQEKIWAVRTQVAELQAAQPVLTLYGRVESPRMTRLSAAVTAFITALEVDEGAQVSAGQLLIQMDDRDARLQLQQQQADLDAVDARIQAETVRHRSDQQALKIETELLALSRRTVKRFENLARRKVGTEEQLDNARRTLQQQALTLNSRRQALADHPNRLAQLQAEYQRSQARRDQAALELERTRIKAPFAGRIARINIAPGDRVRNGDRLLTLYNPARLEVRAQLPAQHLAGIRTALQQHPLQAVTRSDGQTIALQLKRLASEVDGGRAGVDALFQINTVSPPEPGRTLQLELQLPIQSQVLALPPRALYGLNRIYRVVDNRLQGIQVERLGSRPDADGEPQILVRSPRLQAGDRIVTTQLPNAIAGLKVRDASLATKDGEA
ncbi:MAG: biotin/lipoyl-binding protein [Marinobacterium sp.]|nr:biotin/lipoyl-binding protein [Marinobacterium sp.]